MKTFKYKQSQKFRVIINGVSLYTTAKTITSGVGDFVYVNAAIAASLIELTAINATQKSAVGLCGRWHDMDVQIDEMESK